MNKYIVVMLGIAVVVATVVVINKTTNVAPVHAINSTVHSYPYSDGFYAGSYDPYRFKMGTVE